MKINKPLILISNDDGFQAKGINCLVNMVKDFGDVIVCAPDSARSGFACAFSATTPLRIKMQWQEDNVQVWSCNGTPVDCVKMALARICPRRPDIIIGGINHGDNSSVNAHYSGTMGVATEGALQGYRSIAFSLCNHSLRADFTPLHDYLLKFTEYALTNELPPFSCLNINFPLCESFKGVRVCRMAHSRWQNELEEREHPHGRPYFWLVGDCAELEPEATDTDRWALANGYVAVTPVNLDLTHYGLRDKLNFDAL